MNTNTNQLKRFIRNFNFPNPLWENLPLDFPNCNTQDLTKEEKHLFSGIVTAWVVSRPNIFSTIDAFIISNKIPNVLINSKLSKLTIDFATVTIIIFSLISLTYYANVNLNLGIKFLTDFFA